ncbi:LuxR C-terminal-related transcriptional regulator [Vibrio brasiliensis]
MTKLSERDLQVVRLLVAGFTNKHISFELGLLHEMVLKYWNGSQLDSHY